MATYHHSIGSTERDPLLRAENGDVNGISRKKKNTGPMEISRSTRYGILAGIWVSTFLSSINTTLVATLLPSISSEFEKSNQASWLGTGYLLAICTFTPLYGRLCDVLGRRGANQTAVFLSAIGTLACGLSSDMRVLIAARFLSGMGGGGIMTTASIITSDMYSLRSRGLAQGVSSIFNGLGMGLGGPFGGFISDRYVMVGFGWRWAFLIQLPLFLVSFLLTSVSLRYTTPGRGKSPKEVLKRIDYGGSITLLVAVRSPSVTSHCSHKSLKVLSFLVFLSTRYNDEQPWDAPTVILPLILSGISLVAFIVFELCVAREPMLAPFLLKQKITVFIGLSTFLVANCNFAVMYFFPMWFQTVALTSASTAGLHLLPNSIAMSCGSMFAGWVVHRTGKYKFLNLIFGAFPFMAAVFITRMTEDSGPIQLWLSIIPLGFGNAVVLQTVLVALLAHLPQSQMAVGTGLNQLFRGIGQVSGVGVASAIFQYTLDKELGKRIHGAGADELIKRIRHSAKLIATLPPETQGAARDSYAVALRAVFTMAACSTALAFIIRLPIPEISLDYQSTKEEHMETAPASQTTLPSSDSDSEDDEGQPPKH
ncbi:vacuolar amino acid permease [Multifurca ochricompacta]|uniref:Vacuolar amino acid permease n=1 Tax=Multifurca ochricompacta TaxID=376703 RepID=A0AAD4M058_9AGAM|nr:vacuolar amino acid permease [Multifurca ochricompacta]